MTTFESNCSQLPLKDLEEHNAKMKEVAAYPASAEEIRTNGTTRREKNTGRVLFLCTMRFCFYYSPVLGRIYLYSSVHCGSPWQDWRGWHGKMNFNTHNVCRVLQSRQMAISYRTVIYDCSRQPGHLRSELKKWLRFQVCVCVCVCVLLYVCVSVPSSANVWPFVQREDKWRLGKMLEDSSWEISSVWEPSLAATSTAALCCSGPLLLSSLFPLRARQLRLEEAVCEWRAGIFVSRLFSNRPLGRPRSLPWPQTTSQSAPLFFCRSCFSPAAGDAPSLF